ncbi:prephenate dehydrogenase (NADP(+)) [Geranomyces michiganensis]|nr:prephenate dehydrogenase (NADP(+)) [Geranomyces michiganensis]
MKNPQPIDGDGLQADLMPAGGTAKDSVNIGIIGLGDMGLLYARSFLAAGWKNVSVCDLPSRYDELGQSLAGSGMTLHRDGFSIVRISDLIIYSVEAANIESVVALYGPSTKVGAVVCGQTSVKEPEIRAFEAHVPSDVHIVTCHSMHGPRVNPTSQPLVVIRHRSSDEAFGLTVRVLESLRSNIVHLSYLDHDRITADTQVATHLAFLSMGTAWKAASVYPWENPSYIGGVENVKTLLMLRLYSNKWHIYAGLALLNPSAKAQIRQFAKSVSELFKLMIREEEAEFRTRIAAATEFVFGSRSGSSSRPNLLLSDNAMDQFALSAIPRNQQKPNSHLSLLAVVDCWAALRINPYDHLICETPPFRMLLGIAEYLFRTPALLADAVNHALYNKDIRGDDCEFYTATRGWVDVIEVGSFEGYRKRFEDTKEFFKSRLDEGAKVSALLLETLAKRTRE